MKCGKVAATVDNVRAAIWKVIIIVRLAMEINVESIRKLNTESISTTKYES